MVRSALVVVVLAVAAAGLGACGSDASGASGSSGNLPGLFSRATAADRARCAAQAERAPRSGTDAGEAVTAAGQDFADAPGSESAIRTFTMELVDARVVTDRPERLTVDCRPLPTVVRVPVTATAGHPVPLIVVAHGLDGDPGMLSSLLDGWAGAGYVVVAPTFPITDKDEAGNSTISNSVDQAADLSFVIDQVLELGRGSTGPLAGLVDPKHIGAAGMSLGGQAVYALALNSCCRDPRVDAAVMLAAVYRLIPGGRYRDDHLPVMLVQGDADSGYHNSLTAYPRLSTPKWFVTLRGARHAPPFEDPRGPSAVVVDTVTGAFWDAYLGGDAHATARITEAVQASAGRASLRHDTRR